MSVGSTSVIQPTVAQKYLKLKKKYSITIIHCIVLGIKSKDKVYKRMCMGYLQILLYKGLSSTDFVYSAVLKSSISPVNIQG